MFTVRTIQPGESPDSARVESAQYDLEPQLPQGRTVCNLFAQFLSERPPEFREPLPFLNKFAVELDWAAAGGGSAFASLFHEGKPLGMAVLLSGADPESDEQMLQAIHLSILQPLLGGERAEELGQIDERPGVLLVEMNDQPELIPTLHLLMTALASVYFRAVKAMAAAAAETTVAH